MQAFSATVIASTILYFADQSPFDGRRSGVLADLLRQVGWLVGIHF